ncbi:MAG: T9SS type A sorting domain-containing protein [Paludibacter sp.]
MKNKPIYIPIIVFLLVLFTNSAQAQNSLIVKLNNNSQSGYLLSSIDRITFSGGNLVLKYKDAATSSIILSDIDLLHFGIYSEVPELTSNELKIEVYPSPACNYIQLKNLPEEQIHIVVYRLDGGVLINKILMDRTQCIDISNLCNGIYLLKVNNKTLKFTKQ